METTLHRQLKTLYAGTDAQEVQIEGFRIDAVKGRQLIEVQCASLGALRDKLRTLLEGHKVLVVKPLASRKLLVNRESRAGATLSSRYSPVRQSLFYVFDELVHFCNVFPHRRLTLEVVLAVWEEHRIPRRRVRRFRPQHTVVDRVLQQVERTVSLRTVRDLADLLPTDLPLEFTTQELAAGAGVPRWLAQKAAYCLRKTGAVELIGKRGHALLYRRLVAARRRKAA